MKQLHQKEKIDLYDKAKCNEAELVAARRGKLEALRVPQQKKAELLLTRIDALHRSPDSARIVLTTVYKKVLKKLTSPRSPTRSKTPGSGDRIKGFFDLFPEWVESKADLRLKLAPGLRKLDKKSLQINKAGVPNLLVPNLPKSGRKQAEEAAHVVARRVNQTIKELSSCRREVEQMSRALNKIRILEGHPPVTNQEEVPKDPAEAAAKRKAAKSEKRDMKKKSSLEAADGDEGIGVLVKRKFKTSVVTDKPMFID